MSELKGFCGQVDSEGFITSNNNDKCTFQSEQKQYTISYGNSPVTNPVPLVSLTTLIPGLSYMLNPYSSGFQLQAFQNIDGVETPVAVSFNYIVAKIK